MPVSLNLSSEGTFRKGLKINVKFGRSYRKDNFLLRNKMEGEKRLWCKNRNERRSCKGELPLRSLIVRVFDNALAKEKLIFFCPLLKICVYVWTNTLFLTKNFQWKAFSTMISAKCTPFEVEKVTMCCFLTIFSRYFESFFCFVLSNYVY